MNTYKKGKAMTKEGGTLQRIFGGVTAKILDFLIVHNEWDYSKQDIATYSGVSQRHAVIALEKLEKIELVKHTRNIGAAHMYQYNTENKLATDLSKFARNVACQEFEKFAATETAKTEQVTQEIETIAIPA